MMRVAVSISVEPEKFHELQLVLRNSFVHNPESSDGPRISGRTSVMRGMSRNDCP